MREDVSKTASREEGPNKPGEISTKTPFAELSEDKMPTSGIAGLLYVKKYIQKAMLVKESLLHSRLQEGQVIKGGEVTPTPTIKVTKDLPGFYDPDKLAVDHPL